MKIFLLIFYFFIITQPTPFLHFFSPPNPVPPVLVLEVIHSHRLRQLRKVDLGEGEMLQRSSVRRLPLPPHTVLGSASAVHRHGNSGGGRWRGLVWSDSLDKSPDPQMTLGGERGAGGRGEGLEGGEGRRRKMARRKGESREKVNANPVTCDYGGEVQGRLHSNLPSLPPPPTPPVKGNTGAR